MFQVTREFMLAYAHRLPHASGPEQGLHGHNGKVSVTLEGPALNAIGMVMDFVEMKQHIGQWLADHFDYTTILQRDDPLVTILTAAGQRVHVLESSPTPEHLAKLVYERCEATGLPVVEVTFWETANRYATYRGATPDIVR